MHIDVLLGLQWGDEGKGKIVDVFTPDYDIIARFQGGPNAGHTLEFQGKKHVLHHIPSGIFRDNTLNVIGNGVILDPMTFCAEVNGLNNKGINTNSRLCISNKAHLILPTHRLLDQAMEQSKGSNKIGSTLKGIGPAYTDKVARTGLRTGDILNNDFIQRYEQLRNQHVKQLKMYEVQTDNQTIDNIPFADYEARWIHSINAIKNMQIVDSELLINSSLKQGDKILAEGAQGTLLDLDFGSYPFVTSSNTTTAAVCSGLGVPPSSINKVFGVFKAYCTRVGSGPFPTEQADHYGQKLRDQGNEYGSTTGRPRRVGWLDLPALKYAIMLNGVTDLIMTKADVFKDFKTINVCHQYESNGKEIPFSTLDLAQKQKPECKLQPFDGWNQELSQYKTFLSLPDNLKKYIAFIEKETSLPINVISTSADRAGIIFRKAQQVK